MSTPAVFTVAEVAQRIGASESFVADLARRNVVEHIRVGRRSVRFTEAQLDALVAHLTHQPTAPVESLTTARSRRRS